MQDNSCLIIGGGGFIGKNLSNLLLSNKRNMVIIDKFEPDNDDKKNSNENYKYIKGNYSDTKLLAEYLPQVSTIFHLASTVNPRSSNENPIYDVETNLIDFIKLLECLKKYKNKKVILISSGGAVYGNTKAIRIDENHPTNPESSYGIIKLAQEKYLHLYNSLYGIKYCVLRLANPYGPYQELNIQQGVVANFMNKIMRGEEITVMGDGSIVRDFFYIEDACHAMIRAEEYSADYLKIFNIGSGYGYSINKIIEKIEIITQRKAKINFIKCNDADLNINILNVSAAKKFLNWKNEINLTDGLSKTYLYLKSIDE